MTAGCVLSKDLSFSVDRQLLKAKIEMSLGRDVLQILLGELFELNEYVMHCTAVVNGCLYIDFIMLVTVLTFQLNCSAGERIVLNVVAG